MPSTSMENIHAKPSMRNTRFKPSEGNHTTSSRTTPPAAISGNSIAACTAQNSAIAPASVDSVLRAFEGSKAATRLPTNGRRTRL